MKMTLHKLDSVSVELPTTNSKKIIRTLDKVSTSASVLIILDTFDI